MKILAIDSSGLVASAAIVTEDTVIGSYTVNYKKTHSQTLLPMVDELMRMTETDPESLTAIAVAAGPGSFTGLRIGAATVKGLAMVWEKPIVPIPTLEGLAENYAGEERLICPLMDARRNQVYTGLYAWADGEMQTLAAGRCVKLAEILTEVNAGGKHVVFLGDGVDAYREEIAKQVQVSYSFAPAHRSKQDAAALGMAACRAYAKGNTVSAMEFVPEYLRQSQAEREREERIRNEH